MTKKIKDIGSKECKILIPEMKTALQKTLNKYGLSIEQSGGARYGGYNLTIKFEVTVPEKADANAENDFNQYKDMYDIKVPFGFTFKQGGSEYKVVGINHRAKKNKVLLEKDDGKKAHCPVRTVNWQYQMQTPEAVS